MRDPFDRPSRRPRRLLGALGAAAGSSFDFDDAIFLFLCRRGDGESIESLPLKSSSKVGPSIRHSDRVNCGQTPTSRRTRASSPTEPSTVIPTVVDKQRLRPEARAFSGKQRSPPSARPSSLESAARRRRRHPRARRRCCHARRRAANRFFSRERRGRAVPRCPGVRPPSSRRGPRSRIGLFNTCDVVCLPARRRRVVARQVRLQGGSSSWRAVCRWSLGPSGPVTARIIQDGVNGFLASTDDDGGSSGGCSRIRAPGRFRPGSPRTTRGALFTAVHAPAACARHPRNGAGRGRPPTAGPNRSISVRRRVYKRRGRPLLRGC